MRSLGQTTRRFVGLYPYDVLFSTKTTHLKAHLKAHLEKDVTEYR